MSVFDVRKKSTIGEIIFSTEVASDTGSTSLAYMVRVYKYNNNFVEIRDGGEEFILLESKEHARNLQKALDKAIELGWLK